MKGTPIALTHEAIWDAIDALARAHGYSPSGLARMAGLDPTTFNRSKRITTAGKPRWPSTESISKILDATGASMESFVAHLGARHGQGPGVRRFVPLIGFAQAGSAGFFDDSGFPVGSGWDEVDFPGISDENAYALEVSGDSMLPVYRDGDILVVAPNVPVRRGDRVVAKTKTGEVMAKLLKRLTAHKVELGSFNPDFADLSFEVRDIEWIARIVWASQ